MIRNIIQSIKYYCDPIHMIGISLILFVCLSCALHYKTILLNQKIIASHKQIKSLEYALLKNQKKIFSYKEKYDVKTKQPIINDLVPKYWGAK